MTTMKKEAKETAPQQKNRRVAIVRIKGKPGLKVDVRKTLDLLLLYKKNHCVVVPNTPPYRGMLNVAKNAVTWGELDEQTFRLLLEKRGKLPGKAPLTEAYLKEKIKMGWDDFVKKFMSFQIELKEVPGLKHFFKLSPPRHGFERKGIKAQFSMGGALGYRKDKINDLIQRMI